MLLLMRWHGNPGVLRDIIRKNWHKYISWKKTDGGVLRSSVRQHVASMLSCRTPALGAHLFLCKKCNTVLVVPHSCKSVACSSCGKIQTDAWCNELLSDLLDVPYRHLVFTLPWEIRLLLQDNREVAFDVLFRAAGDAILSLTSGTPKPLGKKSRKWLAGLTQGKNKTCRGKKRKPFFPGFISVLHTFGSDMKWNPHLHIIITGGGLSLDNSRWVAAPKRYLVPAPLLGTEWKLRVIEGIRKLHTKKALVCRRLKRDRRERLNIDKLLGHIRKKRWHILIGPSLRSADKAVRYAARYSKRPVMAEGRILNQTNDGYVVFRFKDYHRGKASAVKKFPVMVFMDRLFQHLPERNFRQVRHFGIFSTRKRTTSLKIARTILAQRKKRRPAPKTWEHRRKAAGDKKPLSCPRCGNKMMFWNTLFGNTSSIANLLEMAPLDQIKPKTFTSSNKVLHWEVNKPITLTNHK